MKACVKCKICTWQSEVQFNTWKLISVYFGNMSGEDRNLEHDVQFSTEAATEIWIFPNFVHQIGECKILIHGF
jgi:hypothetical protein